MKRLRTMRAGIGVRVLRARMATRDDRGEIPASVAWAGGMLVLALGVVGILSGKVTDYVNGLSFP